MYAIIREATVRPEAREQYQAAREAFNAAHRAYPGYCGNVTIDAGEGRRLSINLWESEQAYEAATPDMRALAERLMNPHQTAPSRVIYRGPVIADDFTTR